MNKTLAAITTAALLSLSANDGFAGDVVPIDPFATLASTIYRVPGYTFDFTARDLNGRALNGDALTGRSISYVSFDGAQLAGEPMPFAWLEESELWGIKGHGKHVKGDDLVGAVFEAVLDDGGTVQLRVDGVNAGTEPWDKDVFRYTISYPTQDGWMPLCGIDEQGQPLQAIALEGRWDYGQGDTGGAHIDDPWAFTFACEGRALAKCVEMGYKPWQRALQCVRGQGCTKTTLAEMHQTCTRMLRADYCGDGTPHTMDGIEVNAYDVFGIRLDSMPWGVEAEWGPSGAACVVHQRIASTLPADCLARLQRDPCGDPDQLGQDVLLISEIPW